MGDERLNEALRGGAASDAESVPGAKETKGKAPSRGYTITVYIGPERKSRLKRLQIDWNLNASEVVRILLDHSLEAVEKGRLEPEKATITKAKAPAP
ncbi:MAG: hypothetical protein GWN58_11740 [Anaerolineae bacterium]|nr:hypothetical protein [Anaerolineae bacterium]